MAVSQNQVSVGATATLIVPAPVSGCSAHLVNTGSNTVYLGNSAVTNSTGAALIANWFHTIILGPGEALYGACGSGKSTTVGYALTAQP